MDDDSGDVVPHSVSIEEHVQMSVLLLCNFKLIEFRLMHSNYLLLLTFWL